MSDCWPPRPPRERCCDEELRGQALEVPVGVGPPLVLAVAVPQPPGLQIDYTTVTAVGFEAERPDGVLLTWAATILSNTGASTLYAQHAWAVVDLQLPGTYWVAVVLTLQGSPMRCREFPLLAVSPQRLGLPGACLPPVRVGPL